MVYGVIPPGDREALVPSYVPLPVGALSRDRSAILGAGGHLFILEGTNSLLAQYAAPDTTQQKDALVSRICEWKSLVARRSNAAAVSGARFLQVCVPDKSSVLTSEVPGLGPVTPLLEGVESALSTDSSYVSGRQALLADAQSESDLSARWLKFDSHVSPRGAALLAGALVGEVADISFMGDVEFLPGEPFAGDLAARFFGNPIPEPDVTPQSRWLEAVARDRALVERRYPQKGHTGLALHWRTPHAPIDAKVLVFGNSFFGGGDLPRGLNYWVSRAFREHRFVWSAEMIDEEVAKERPDVIICQTVERFMAAVPQR